MRWGVGGGEERRGRTASWGLRGDQQWRFMEEEIEKRIKERWRESVNQRRFV